MHKTMKAAALAALAIGLLLGAAVSPAAGQAAAPNCPPGQPTGRPPGTPPAQPGQPDGRPPQYPPGRCQLALSQSSAARGESFTASGGGFVPGEAVTLSIAGSPVKTVVADGNGAFTTDIVVPANAPIGRTEVLASSATQQLSAAFEVTGAPAAAASSGSRQSSSGLPRTGAELAATAALGSVLVALGALLVVSARRERAVTP